MFDDRFRQPRRIVVKVQVVRFFVEAEPLQTVGIREIAERTILLGCERLLQFVSYGHECHVRNYTIP